MADPHETAHEEAGSRRRFLKQAATVAWASPMIVTMMSRSAMAQPAQCGTLLLFSQPGGGSQLRCAVTQPCGSAQNCQPTGFLNPGDPCFCVNA